MGRESSCVLRQCEGKIGRERGVTHTPRPEAAESLPRDSPMGKGGASFPMERQACHPAAGLGPIGRCEFSGDSVLPETVSVPAFLMLFLSLCLLCPLVCPTHTLAWCTSLMP